MEENVGNDRMETFKKDNARKYYELCIEFEKKKVRPIILEEKQDIDLIVPKLLMNLGQTLLQFQDYYHGYCL